MVLVKKTLAVSWQLLIILLVSLAGDKMAAVFSLPIPGSVVGMLLLFTLLSLGVIKPAQIQEVTGFLLKHMAFFFIPVTVGLMNYWEIFHQQGIVLIALLAISLFIAFIVFRFTSLKNEGGK
ncbi:CidA/LrgA family protein [Anaerospora sp.]|uniref:CidA/LrgA family protein n=1 Tax=Anaerospora sp. TaxID=1960278 RepID=UPI0028976321|nr:CidA/LrgA family protein [Anaerospora sp.]